MVAKSVYYQQLWFFFFVVFFSHLRGFFLPPRLLYDHSFLILFPSWFFLFVCFFQFLLLVFFMFYNLFLRIFCPLGLRVFPVDFSIVFLVMKKNVLYTFILKSPSLSDLCSHFSLGFNMVFISIFNGASTGTWRTFQVYYYYFLACPFRGSVVCIYQSNIRWGWRQSDVTLSQ